MELEGPRTRYEARGTRHMSKVERRRTSPTRIKDASVSSDFGKVVTLMMTRLENKEKHVKM